MTAPTHAAHIADKLARRNERAFRLQSLLRKRGAALTRIFIQDGILLWRFKREELWRELGAPSFDSWVADPDNKQESASKVHLQIQVIETCWCYFDIDRALLYGVGYRKWQMIVPEIELWKAYAEKYKGFGPEAYWKSWERVRGWIHAAQTNSVSALGTLLIENSIQYTRTDGENASTPPVGGQTGQFEALIERQPFDIVWLRASKDVDELLARLGLSDITAGQIYLSAFRPRPKDTP